MKAPRRAVILAMLVAAGAAGLFLLEQEAATTVSGGYRDSSPELILGPVTRQMLETAPLSAERIAHTQESLSVSVATAILIVDGITGSPVPHASVELLGLPSVLVLQAGSGGRVEVNIPAALGGRVPLLISSPGYSRRMYWCDTGGPEDVVELIPAGQVMVSVVDGHGRAVEGMEVLLLPPLSSRLPWDQHWTEFRGIAERKSPEWIRGLALRRWMDGHRALRPGDMDPGNPEDLVSIESGMAEAVQPHLWVQRSNKDGIVLWEDVPAADGYQCAFTGRSDVQWDPPLMVASPRTANGQVMVRGSEIGRELSGQFPVRPGSTAAAHVIVGGSGSIKGVVSADSRGVGSPFEFMLRRESTPEEDRRSGFGRLDMERSGTIDPGGSFHLRDLTAGWKHLDIRWTEPDHHHHLVHRRVYLAPDQELDLGLLSTSTEPPLCVRVGVVDGSGVAMDATQLGLDSVILDASALPDETEPRTGYGLKISIPMEQRVWIHGIAEESVRLLAFPGNRWWGIDTNRASVNEPASLNLAGRPNDCADLELICIATVEVMVEARLPRGSLVASMQGLVGDRGLRMRSSPSEPDTFKGLVRVQPGNHTLLLASGKSTSMLPNPSWFARRQVTVESGATSSIHVDMEPAVTVEGDLNGQALSAAQPTVVILQAADGSRLAHQVHPHGGHGFRIYGVMPGGEYRLSTRASAFRARADAGPQSVELFPAGK